MNQMNGLRTGDARVNRRLADSLYSSAKEYAITGKIDSNPILAERLDSLPGIARMAYLFEAIDTLRHVNGYGPHAKQLEELTVKYSIQLFQKGEDMGISEVGNTEFDPESIPGVVTIAHDFYVKSPKSLVQLLLHLNQVGYDVRDISSEKGISHDKPPREVQEKNGWVLWYAKLSDKVFEIKGECGSCGSLIDTRGIQTHEHQCGSCGDYTYINYVNGGEISFLVVDDPHVSLNHPTFLIHSYEKDKEKLNLYVNPKNCPERQPRRMRNFDLSVEESCKMVPDLLEKFPETFSLNTIDGIKVLSVNHKNDGYIHEHGINTTHLEGDKRNYRIVNLFKGQKFSEWGSLPIPESFSIYEAWHWAPLNEGPDLYKKIMSAAGQVSRKDYYYQDGRPAFIQTQIDWMLRFIDEFTTINSDVVRLYLHTGLSGPDFIDTLASLTGHQGYIHTAPNIGNAMVMFGKIVEGRPITEQEIAPATDGVCKDDPHKVLETVLGDDFVRDVIMQLNTPRKLRGKIKNN